MAAVKSRLTAPPTSLLMSPTEDDLGIYDDVAECEDLTDSENEDEVVKNEIIRASVSNELENAGFDIATERVNESEMGTGTVTLTRQQEHTSMTNESDVFVEHDELDEVIEEQGIIVDEIENRSKPDGVKSAESSKVTHKLKSGTRVREISEEAEDTNEDIQQNEMAVEPEKEVVIDGFSEQIDSSETNPLEQVLEGDEYTSADEVEQTLKEKMIDAELSLSRVTEESVDTIQGQLAMTSLSNIPDEKLRMTTSLSNLTDELTGKEIFEKSVTDLDGVFPDVLQPRIWTADDISVQKLETLGFDDNRKVNTPASHMTGDSRLPSRQTRLESREAVYNQALRLLSTRCYSEGRRPIINALNEPFQPKYYYVKQTKPLPMPPLKVWNGYHGNVYFEPLSIKPISRQDETTQTNILDSKPPKPPQHRKPNKLSLERRKSQPVKGSPRSKIPTPQKILDQLRDNSHQDLSTLQNVMLDKDKVLDRFNVNINEDLYVLEGQENTGTLTVMSPIYYKKRDAPIYDKDKIHKGLVSSKYPLKQSKIPKLAVTGDRFMKPPSLSPLLRTQTQYSLSTQRGLNSPDVYNSGLQKLPPLEQLRASLRHMNTSPNDPYRAGYVRPRVKDGYKPMIKYSRDVKYIYEKRTNYSKSKS